MRARSARWRTTWPITWRVRLVALLLASPLGVQAVSVIDDSGHTVTLAQPARLIVSPASHATELLFAAGAGAAVIGVSQYSDYPPAEKSIASVGGSAALDLERIVALKPDLLVVWTSGNSAAQIARLRLADSNLRQRSARFRSGGLVNRTARHVGGHH